MRQINNIIFMGTPEFAVPSLQSLIDHGEHIAAVICQPDRPKGRGRKVQPPPVKILASEHHIPVLQPVKLRTEEFQQTLQGYNPDLFIVTAYGRILPENIVNLPTLGTINVHGSLLPKYRGAAPIQRAILNGDAQTGITIMQMDVGMDTGDMLLQKTLTITDDDTAATLAVKMATLGGDLLTQALDLLKEDRLPPIPQNNDLATDAPMLTKDEARIDWQHSARQISCQIRGLDPWPKATTTLGKKWLRPFKPVVSDTHSDQTPGTIIDVGKQGITVATGKGNLLFTEIQLEGKKRMGVDAFILGYQLKTGIILGQS
jgi:methionyl-tRNA formyltransferase